ncbi:MAG: ImmA/IrrE family metallo-endopeptidase [Eubacteriales bacterium]|nr:ImmA/IrrE family metallo-endopeptidase [Eubacteriales bacterium]
MSHQPDYDRAATAACRVLLRLQVDSLPVRPLEMLRRCRDTYLCTFDQAADVLNLDDDELDRLSGGADAFTFREMHGGRERYVVCYRTGGNPARLNFTLAHELGHIVLRHQDTGPAAEAEADCFASHLLCPEAVIRAAACRSAEVLAQLCYISRPAAEKAMARTKGRVEEAILQQVRELLMPSAMAEAQRLATLANNNHVQHTNEMK